MRAWLGVILAVGILALSGCINYDEEMQIDRWGGGWVKVHYSTKEDMAKLLDEAGSRLAADPKLTLFGSIGPLFSAEGVRQQLGKTEGLTASDVRQESKDGERHIYLTLEFEHVEALNKASIFRAGRVSLNDLSGGRTEYLRELGEIGGMGRATQMYPAIPPLAAAMKNAKIRFTVHLPGKVLESNATNSIAADSVVWESGIPDLKEISIMTATFAPPGSRLLILLCVAVGALVLLVLLKLLWGRETKAGAA